ncbi:MAG: hypothetical protein WAM26_09440 [Nitrososphaeraceae archaeon]
MATSFVIIWNQRSAGLYVTSARITLVDRTILGLTSYFHDGRISIILYGLEQNVQLVCDSDSQLEEQILL